MMRIDDTWNLFGSTVKQSHSEISAQYAKACKRKVRKTFQYSKFQKGHDSYKN